MKKLTLKIGGMKTLTQEKKMMLITVGIIALTLLLIIFTNAYRSVSAKNELRKLTLEKQNYTSRYTYYAKLSHDKKIITKLQPELDRLTKKLLSEVSTSQALDAITQLGESKKITFVRFNPRETIPQKYYNILPINISFIGTYYNTRRFIESLTQQNYLLVISKIRMVLRGNSGNKIQTLLTLNLYYNNKAKNNVSKESP